MLKTSEQIEIGKETKVMLEEIRDNNPGFDLSAEVEALVRSIHAAMTEVGNTKPVKEQSPQVAANSAKGSNVGNFADCQNVIQNVIHIHGATDGQLSEILARVFPSNSQPAK